MGPAERFGRGKQVASYLGLIPSEHSSGGRQQRLGHIGKQGNPFLRGLLVEAAQSAVQHEPEMRRAYQRLAQRKCRALAKVAITSARGCTANRLSSWMIRKTRL
jgi:transposase